jgi:hypothetical protein
MPTRTIADYEVLNNRCIQKCPPGKVRDHNGKKNICTAVGAGLKFSMMKEMYKTPYRRDLTSKPSSYKRSSSRRSSSSRSKTPYSPDLSWKPSGYTRSSSRRSSSSRSKTPYSPDLSWNPSGYKRSSSSRRSSSTPVPLVRD